jgi:hypothetical protein
MKVICDHVGKTKWCELAACNHAVSHDSEVNEWDCMAPLPCMMSGSGKKIFKATRCVPVRRGA